MRDFYSEYWEIHLFIATGAKTRARSCLGVLGMTIFQVNLGLFQTAFCIDQETSSARKCCIVLWIAFVLVFMQRTGAVQVDKRNKKQKLQFVEKQTCNASRAKSTTVFERSSDKVLRLHLRKNSQRTIRIEKRIGKEARENEPRYLCDK